MIRLLRVVAMVPAVCIGLAPRAVLSQATAPGYDVQRSQTVQNAQPGWVGRKSTDRQLAVGNTKETAGQERTHVMTFGGFARRCPAADGTVLGNFEYSLTYNETGLAQRQQHARRVTATLKGQVGDDGRLQDVELDGEFATERSGNGIASTSSSRAVRTRFKAGAGGEPDWEAMRSATEMAGDIAVASVVLMAGELYRQAELVWLQANECVEFAFDPPSDTRALGPNEQAQVRTELRTKEGKAATLWKDANAGVLNGAGRVSPGHPQAQPGAPATLSYTASANPRTGHGFDIGTRSRAGLAEAKWRIIDLGRFEGSFTQTDRTSGEGRDGVVSGSIDYTISGNLLWTPAAGMPEGVKPSFGDVRSTFYRPGGGDITVEVATVGQSLGVACGYKGRKAFPIASLPPEALEYLWLEIAADGRYRMSLGMPSHFLQWEVEGQCMGKKVTSPVNAAALMVGVQQGKLNAEEGVAGRLAAPLRFGPRAVDGQWSFAKKTK
jgi:hypothetical protein